MRNVHPACGPTSAIATLFQLLRLPLETPTGITPTRSDPYDVAFALLAFEITSTGKSVGKLRQEQQRKRLMRSDFSDPLRTALLWYSSQRWTFRGGEGMTATLHDCEGPRSHRSRGRCFQGPWRDRRIRICAFAVSKFPTTPPRSCLAGGMAPDGRSGLVRGRHSVHRDPRYP
jgi:hypothetical protein